MEYYSAKKKNEVMPFAAIQMDLDVIIWNEVQSVRERKISNDITYMWNFKWYKWTYLQSRNSLTDNRRHTYHYQRGDGGTKLGVWD